MSKTNLGGKQIYNCTPHDVLIITEPRNICISTSGINIRVDQETEPLYYLGGIPITETKWKLNPFPFTYNKDIMYIVSSIVAMAYPDRRDLLVPTDPVRDGSGRIIGCKSLSINPYNSLILATKDIIGL